MNSQPQIRKHVAGVVVLSVLLNALAGCGGKPLSPEEATAELVALSLEIGPSDIGAVRKLIDHGADVNAMDADGWTPLDNATNGECIEIAELLLENGAEIRGQLIWASRHDYIDFVRLFLKHNADVNAVDEEGKTALYYALEEGNTEVVRLLKESGAR